MHVSSRIRTCQRPYQIRNPRNAENRFQQTWEPDPRHRDGCLVHEPGYARGVAVQAEEGSGNTGSGDTTYISDTNTEVQNIQALDKQVVKNAQDIAANKTTTTTNTNNITANKTEIDKNTASIATNTSNIAANTGAISNETTARTKAISDLKPN